MFLGMYCNQIQKSVKYYQHFHKFSVYFLLLISLLDQISPINKGEVHSYIWEGQVMGGSGVLVVLKRSDTILSCFHASDIGTAPCICPSLTQSMCDF